MRFEIAEWIGGAFRMGLDSETRVSWGMRLSIGMELHVEIGLNILPDGTV